MTPTFAQWLPTVSHPLIAWSGLAAIAVPLAIHLFAQLRRTVMPWAAMRFLTEAIRHHRRRLRLEQWILLALRCLLVLMAGLAVAGLFHRGPFRSLPGSLPPRHVLIVLDDSLTSQVRETDGTTRFDQLCEEARVILGGLQAGEPVAILRASRPVSTVVAPWSPDHDAAHQALEQLKPRFSHSELVPAVEKARRHLAALPASTRATVFLLSDMAYGTVGLPSATQEVADDRLVRWFVRRPAAAVENHQVASVVPRRRVVVREDGGRATMQFDVILRRISEVAGVETTSLQVSSGTASARMVHHWREGERVSAAIPVSLSFTAGVEPGMKTVSTTLAATTLEKLVADDQHHCLVEVRSKLHVGIVDAMDHAGQGPVPPRRWVAAALAPNADTPLQSRDRIEVAVMNVSDLTAARCRDLDAIVLLRPDRVGAEGYAVLRSTVQRGALVAVTPPALDQPALWAEPLCRAMGLGWNVDLESVRFDPPAALAGNLPVPDAFGALMADWRSLLRPVRVQRLFAIDPGPNGAAVWLRLAAGDRQPFLLAGEVGAGLFVVLTSALDQQWTNLPTKPLWLPLLHEIVRGAAGRRAVVDFEGVCGEALVLDAPWSNIVRLWPASGSPPGGIPLRRVAETVVVDEPGVYLGDPEGRPHLTINVDPEAGDTRATGDAVLEQWLESLGGWQWWEAGKVDHLLAEETPWREMTPSLMGILLVLVVTETCLARWFSHPPMRGPADA